MFGRLSGAVLLPLAALGGMLLAITIFFRWRATNMGFSLARLAPKFDRMNPVQQAERTAGQQHGSLSAGDGDDPGDVLADMGLVKDRLPEILRLPLMPVSRRGGGRGC